MICFLTVDRLDKKTSLYILYNIGDQFCSVMQEEKKAITCVETDGKQGKARVFYAFLGNFRFTLFCFVFHISFRRKLFSFIAF